MLFRVVVVLTAAIGAAIGAVIYPFLGLLVLVFINFGRPQDDRPNILALHIPMMMLIAVMVGMLLRLKAFLPALVSALKRTRILLLLTMLIAISVLANRTDESKSGFVDFFPLIVFCVVTVAMVSTVRRLQVYLAMLLASGVYVMQTVLRNPKHIVEQIGSNKFVRMDMASHSMFGNANYLALYMVMLIFLSLALTAAYKSYWVRAALISIAGLAGYVFFLANSRGASIALAAGLMLMWMTSRKKLKGVLIGIVLLSVFAAFAPDSYWNRLQTISNYQEDSSATGRLELWGIAMTLIPQNPLFGVGFMNFERYAFNSPHEAYLQIASEVGLPALVVYISLLVSGLWSAFRARQLSTADTKEACFIHAASQGILCCVFAVVVQGFTTGLAHREVVHVFVCLAYTVRALAEQKSDTAPIEGPTLLPESPPEIAPWTTA